MSDCWHVNTATLCLPLHCVDHELTLFSIPLDHTMIRVKDKDVSIKFYEDIMGMKLMRTNENKDAGFTLYFLAYGAHPGEATANGVNPGASREGFLELTWNHGTEKEEGKIYHDGNSEPYVNRQAGRPRRPRPSRVMMRNLLLSPALLNTEANYYSSLLAKVSGISVSVWMIWTRRVSGLRKRALRGRRG